MLIRAVDLSGRRIKLTADWDSPCLVAAGLIACDEHLGAG